MPLDGVSLLIRDALPPLPPVRACHGLKRALDPGESRRKDAAWSAGLVDGLPGRWITALLGRWRERYAVEPAAANLAHLRECAKVGQVAHLGVPADANDDEICKIADESARDALRRVEEARAAASTRPVGGWGPAVMSRAIDAKAMPMLYDTAALWTLGDWMADIGAADFWAATVERAKLARAAVARACCARWWRRLLRVVHAQAVEGAARRIGFVHKRAGCYASDETVNRRAGQIRRNARALESVTAINDAGQSATLAELAAKGPANREIRRHELMTRVAGFELIAKDLGHVAYFVTLTCPSRMHAWRSKPGSQWATEPNPKHDGTRPDEAQKYLTKQWARFRAAADRAGLGFYGFRIAEPNHDGTPHWHCLLFFPSVARPAGKPAGALLGGRAGDRGRASVVDPVAVGVSVDRGCLEPGGRPAYRVAVRLLRRYFLRNDSGAERGARKHRVKVERIDWTRGSAAGYIAKYVAKNIDGYKVEKDLYGNDCLTASQRVDAWASTWRVRQFQQIGGAPVTIWRELRRVHPEQAEAGPAVALALDAVNAANSNPDAETEAVKRYTAAHAWQTYLTLQGGHRPRRADLRVRMLRESTGEIGRYGEPMAARPAGVLMQVVEHERRPALGIVPAMTVQRQITREVESERALWTIVPSGGAEAALARIGSLPRGEAVRPWSPVINCTEPGPARMFAPAVQRHARLRKWADWSAYRVKTADGGKAQPKDAQRERTARENRSP